jgi:hypothetical protein
VEKLSPPPTGIPDWLVVHAARGCRLVEAKTLEAVQRADWWPISACSRAQQFTLRMVHEHGGYAGMVVLAEEGYVELRYEDCLKRWPERTFRAAEVLYNA